MQRIVAALVGILLVLACIHCGAQDAEALVLLGRVITATGIAPIDQGAVVIIGEVIHAVGRADRVEIPGNATVIDLGEATILPAFINAHIHNACSSQVKRQWASAGVTTVRDLGVRYISGWERCVTCPDYGPRNANVVWAGPLITVPDGYPICGSRHESLTVTSAEDAADQVESLIEIGVDVIKITITTTRCETLSPAEIRAITDAAHSRGIPVSAHIDVAMDAQLALEGGVDDLAHVPVDRMSSDLIANLVAAGVSMVSTLAPLNYREPGGWPEMESNLIRFARAGGLVAMGNDAGWMRGPIVGMPMGEIRLLANAGIDPLDIIRFCTINSAIVCGVSETLGSLEPGKQADILVARGDPLSDIEVLDSPLLVLRRGTIITDHR